MELDFERLAPWLIGRRRDAGQVLAQQARMPPAARALESLNGVPVASERAR